ncbi:TPA: hypothetical protein DCZ46_03320 [Candidatus Campbellbacteria bacterium]|nr:MAG: seg [Candidatus Campbellbacteria bacterium GW2011_OD1_34_28]KKP74840.1 MAG: hypothetical protein UR74_C0002G0106 [Candidatus Campbellbacteria bacterium GW2011_GWD2_35_24]KKP75726.1 MAG: hypothetical protein UR75_C0002G0107 [Candidatus Campbellbacteria bacterium GW2011_GWC2_35_28]KKP77026.1 MAG: hypothetical protein UR76_C0002G0227 [Candidatus Campbellbacteria bacterium GW2011_GWC1_35_31]KKP78952.1 MAG: hypothetical protein UR79_C0002G0227 [Candidatus Campbellbacteria bacterium GW2011_GW
MKRQGGSHAAVKAQRANFAREWHYANVENIAKEQIDKEKRSKRFDIIFDKKIKKGEEINLGDGIKALVRSVGSDGIIILENWDEIDPLDLLNL